MDINKTIINKYCQYEAYICDNLLTRSESYYDSGVQFYCKLNDRKIMTILTGDLKMPKLKPSWCPKLNDEKGDY